MQSLHSGSSACLKSKAQTLDVKFAFWVFCLPKIQGPNLGCKVCILGLLPAKNPRPKPWMQSLHSRSSARPKLWMQSLHSRSSACLKFKAQTLEEKFTFWAFCLPETQGPNLGCKVCILGLLPAWKFKAQTLDAKFAFWVFCLLKNSGPNLGCKVCILGLLPA